MLTAFRDSIRDKVGDLGMRKFLFRLFALMQNVTLFKEAKQLWSMICIVLGSRSTTLYVEEQTTTLKALVKAASLDDLDIEETASGGKYGTALCNEMKKPVIKDMIRKQCIEYEKYAQNTENGGPV